MTSGRDAEKDEQFRRLIYNFTHDLKEPVSKVTIISELLSEKAKALGPDEKDYLARLGDSAKRMKTLIASLAEYARFFKTPAHFFRIDTNGLLKKVLADLAPEIAACGAKVEIRGSSVIKAEPQQMEYAVRCLILNAFKFAKPGAAPAVTIESRAAGPVTEILVSDEGIGFAPDSAETVFEPFRTLHPKDQYEGTGIGLSIVRRIVQNHGGGITASAAPGKGATFMITLPND